MSTKKEYEILPLIAITHIYRGTISIYSL
jgi:hypothetical protein